MRSGKPRRPQRYQTTCKCTSDASRGATRSANEVAESTWMVAGFASAEASRERLFVMPAVLRASACPLPGVPLRSLHPTFAATELPHRMPSLEVLLNDHTVSVFSPLQTRLSFINDIDLALNEVESAYVSIKTANRSPVKQALKLFRRASKFNMHLESRVLEDENASVVSLAKEVTSGHRTLPSLQLFEVLLLRRALRTRRNSLSSISSLPTEILTSILELCPKIDADLPDFGTAKLVLGLTVSHVCRRWREIAMKSSQFWSHIVLSQPRWALAMLHRSRAAPLVVAASFESSGVKHIAARDLVLAQIFRIRRLHLRLPQRCSIPNSLLLPAPLLDAFNLHYSGPSEIFVDMPLFGGEITSLRHLSLQYCLLEWNSPLFDNLVSLELIHSPVHVGLLARIPHLRALTLVESFPQTFQTPEPVVLDLETLKLTGNSTICYAFLRTISIPKSRIVLNVPYLASDMWIMWDALERHRKEADDPVICGLKIADLPPTSDGASHFEVGLFTQASCTAAEASTSPSPFLAINLTKLSSPVIGWRGDISSPVIDWREDVILAMMRNISLPQVTALTLNCAAAPELKLPPSFHRKSFRSAAFHRDITLFTNQLERDPLMSAGDRFDPVSANAAVLYPRLRKLTFHPVAFNSDSERERHMEIMLDWLAQRKRLNLAIEEIRLVGCTLSTADLGSLKELVGHVYMEDG